MRTKYYKISLRKLNIWYKSISLYYAQHIFHLLCCIQQGYYESSVITEPCNASSHFLCQVKLQNKVRQNSTAVEGHGIHGQVDFPLYANMNKHIPSAHMCVQTDRWMDTQTRCTHRPFFDLIMSV